MRHKKKLKFLEKQEQQIQKQKKLSLLFAIINLLAIATLIVSSILPNINAEPGYLSLVDSFTANRGTGTPADAATSSTGEIYVSYPDSDQITVYSPDGVYIKTIGYSGSADGQLDNPRGLAFDNSDNLWVVDKGNDRVQKFDSSGNFLDKITAGPNFSLSGSSADLGGIAVDSFDELYIISYNSGTLTTSIQKFDSNGDHLSSLVSSVTAGYDLALDSNDNLYLSGQNNIYVFDSTTGTQTDTWGGSGSSNGQFSSNRGLSIDDSDSIYVADRSNNRVQKFDSSGTYLTKWGTLGSSAYYENDGKFYLLNAITTYGSNVFTAESNKLQRFSNTGTYQAKWRTPGLGEQSFQTSPSLNSDSTGNIYALNTDQKRVEKFDSSGVLSTSWAAESYAGEVIDILRDFTIDNLDNVYVLSTNGLVQKFNSSGAYQTLWNTGEIAPSSITSDSSNNIYVSSSSGSINKYSSTGTLLDQWSNPSTLGYDSLSISTDSSDNLYYLSYTGEVIITDDTGTLLDQWNFTPPTGYTSLKPAIDSSGNIFINNGTTITKYSSNGTSLGQFGDPADYQLNSQGLHIDSSDNLFIPSYDQTITKYTNAGDLLFSQKNSTSGISLYPGVKGVATDSSNNIYTAGQNTDRIQKRSSDGTLSLEFGTSGTGDGQFQNPQGIAVSGSSVYVVDSGNDRIQIFDTSGVYQSQFGSTGNGNGQFQNPQGIAISGSSVYVVDSGNDRVQVFNTGGVYQSQFGASGIGNGQFQNPQGIAVSSLGDIYVSQYAKDSIQQFSSSGTYQSTLDDPEDNSPVNPLSLAIDPQDCLFTNTISYDLSEGANPQCAARSLQNYRLSGGIAFSSDGDIWAAQPVYLDYNLPNQVFYSNLALLSQAPGLYFTTPADLPNAPLNQPYSVFLETDKDPATNLYFYEYVIDGDPLLDIPPGLSLNETTGELSGTPTTEGEYSFQIQVYRTDISGSQDNRTFTLTVGDIPDPLEISVAGNFAGGTQDEAYSSDLPVTLEDVDQQLPLTQEVTSGTLPPGLSLNTSDSTLSLSGTPTTAGSYLFTVTITDNQGTTYDKEFTVIIAEPGEEPEEPEEPPVEEPPTTTPPTSGGGTTNPNRRVPRTNLGPSIPVPDPAPEQTPQTEAEEEVDDITAPTAPIITSELTSQSAGPWILLTLLTLTGLGYLADSIWQYSSRRSTLRSLQSLNSSHSSPTRPTQINEGLLSIRTTLSKLLYTSPEAYAVLSPTYTNLEQATNQSLSLNDQNQSPQAPELGRIALPVITGTTMLVSALLVYRSYTNIQASGPVYLLLILAVLVIAIGGAIYALEEYQQNKILLQEEQEANQPEVNTPDTAAILQNLEPHLNRLEQQSLSLSDPQISQELTTQISQLRNLGNTSY